MRVVLVLVLVLVVGMVSEMVLVGFGGYGRVLPVSDRVRSSRSRRGTECRALVV